MFSIYILLLLSYAISLPMNIWFPSGWFVFTSTDPSNRFGFGSFRSPQQYAETVVESVKGFDDPCLILAMASLETSYGTNMPNKEEQLSRGKGNTEMEEEGMLRMNYQMLKELGYEQWQLDKMNSYASVEGNVLSGQSLYNAINTYGLEGFMNYHRGGISQYNAFLNTGSSSDDVLNYWRLVGTLTNSCKAQYEMVIDSCVDYLPWIDSSKFGLNEI